MVNLKSAALSAAFAALSLSPASVWAQAACADKASETCRVEQRSSQPAVSTVPAAPAPVVRGQACREDAAKYCAKLKAGSAKWKRCLKKRIKVLSPACRAELGQAAR